MPVLQKTNYSPCLTGRLHGSACQWGGKQHGLSWQFVFFLISKLQIYVRTVMSFWFCQWGGKQHERSWQFIFVLIFKLQIYVWPVMWFQFITCSGQAILAAKRLLQGQKLHVPAHLCFILICCRPVQGKEPRACRGSRAHVGIGAGARFALEQLQPCPPWISSILPPLERAV